MKVILTAFSFIFLHQSVQSEETPPPCKDKTYPLVIGGYN
jgi:hypothetical protein